MRDCFHSHEAVNSIYFETKLTTWPLQRYFNPLILLVLRLNSPLNREMLFNGTQARFLNHTHSCSCKTPNAHRRLIIRWWVPGRKRGVCEQVLRRMPCHVVDFRTGRNGVSQPARCGLGNVNMLTFPEQGKVLSIVRVLCLLYWDFPTINRENVGYTKSIPDADTSIHARDGNKPRFWIASNSDASSGVPSH